jgi:clan AA aspartic protease
MAFVDGAVAAMVRITNPFADASYPTAGAVAAVIDTGYSGFLVVPEEIFLELRLDQLSTKKARATLADGRVMELTGSYGTVSFVRESFSLDGLIETNRDLSEVLLGMDGIRRFILTIDSCRRSVVTEVCRGTGAVRG